MTTPARPTDAPKALVFDLDGTLLQGEDLPPANAIALRAAADAGMHIMIATARWRQMAENVMADIGVSGPVIACSGAHVHDPESGRDLFDERLPAGFVDELYALCDSTRCIATVTVEDEVLLKLDGEPDASAMAPEMRWVRQLTGANPTLPRVAAIQGGAANAAIRSELAPRWAEQVVFLDSIGPTGKIIMAITAAKAMKGHALRAACEHLGISTSATIAFGDSDNDLDMFAAAGQSVAMGQAAEHVKAAATHVTLPCADAGVAYAVNHLLKHGALPDER